MLFQACTEFHTDSAVTNLYIDILLLLLKWFIFKINYYL